MSWPYIISVFCLVFCCFSFLYFRSYINKKTSFEGTLKEVREEVNRLLRSIDEITDKDISLVEDREKRLKELLDEADRRLAVLARELDRRSVAEKTYREMGVQSLVAPQPRPAAPEEKTEPPPVEPVQPAEEQVRELAAAGISANVIASRLGVSISEAELAVALHSRRNS